MPWALEWRSENILHGVNRHLMCRAWGKDVHRTGYTVMVFRTRQQARDYRDKYYGYIRNRPDLKAEPHGWKLPRVIKVTVTVAPLQER